MLNLIEVTVASVAIGSGDRLYRDACYFEVIEHAINTAFADLETLHCVAYRVRHLVETNQIEGSNEITVWMKIVHNLKGLCLGGNTSPLGG